MKNPALPFDRTLTIEPENASGPVKIRVMSTGPEAANHGLRFLGGPRLADVETAWRASSDDDGPVELLTECGDELDPAYVQIAAPDLASGVLALQAAGDPRQSRFTEDESVLRHAA